MLSFIFIIVVLAIFRAVWLSRELDRYETFMPKARSRIKTNFILMIAKFWIWDMEKFMNYQK